MAQAAGELADRIIVTSDNPRSEDPQAIIAEIMLGFGPQLSQAVVTEPDREAAIRLALKTAGPGDVVLIAGKGHEDYQIIGNRRIHFDDVEVTIRAAEQLARAATETAKK
jgi:UDP-N-acetylmuramoyl-L-alanyl-D-glutamate--2,6-diaminopimelate ligase